MSKKEKKDYTEAIYAEELIKCGKDPIYFINNYCKIRTMMDDGSGDTTSKITQFKTWPFQDDCLKDFLSYKNNIIVKSRQIGLSTLVAAYCTWNLLFYKNQNILIIATKQAVAKNLLDKVKIIITNLPDWMKLWELEEDNKHSIKTNTGSRIQAIPTSKDAGVSETLSLLVIDEAALIQNFDELWKNLKPTISTGGRAIILSSPRGVSNQFHKLYVGSAKKSEGEKPGQGDRNTFNGIILPWQVVPTRDQKWFERETKDMSPKAIAQEYCCDFLSSGDTVFSENDLLWLRTCQEEPRITDGFDRNIWIWETPQIDRKYILSADVARGDARDYSAFVIIDPQTQKVVAEYKGKMPPDKFGEVIDEIGRKYNNADVIVENKAVGYTTLTKLKDLDYPALYFGQPYNGVYRAKTQDIAKAGFDTNVNSRTIIIAKLEEIIRNRKISIPSSRFEEELRTFVWANSKAKAQKGYNDDLIMCYAIGCWYFTINEYFRINEQKTTKELINLMRVEKKTVDTKYDVSIEPRKQYEVFLPFSSNSPNLTSQINNRGIVQPRLSNMWKWVIKD